MITLRDFLKIANNQVIIGDGVNRVLRINDDYFDKDLLSEKLLDSEVAIVEADNDYLIVELEGGIG